MTRTLSLALALGLLLARPAWAAQAPKQDQKQDSGESSSRANSDRPQPANQDQKQDAGESSSRANPDHPQPAEPATLPAKDAPSPEAAGAAHDIEVAEYYLRKGDVDAAIGRLQDAIQLQPKLPRPYLLLAHACERKKDKAAAAKYFQEYLRVSPDAPDAKKIEKKIDKLTAR
ncbi:MAG: tetratricopeptide repeat protein [Acidobacteriia bacterium]|nr:tetratricopeptide repeat protein [Terriglobia bacterium]